MIYIGTSGWVYKEWAKSFYPKDVPVKERFAFYAKHFPTVEINASFCRLPTDKAIQQWREQTPPGFLYTAGNAMALMKLVGRAPPLSALGAAAKKKNEK